MARSQTEKKIAEAAATLDPNIERHRQQLLTLKSTGRHIVWSYPQDMTDTELLDFAAWLLVGFRQSLPREDGIVVVRGALVD